MSGPGSGIGDNSFSFGEMLEDAEAIPEVVEGSVIAPAAVVLGGLFYATPAGESKDFAASRGWTKSNAQTHEGPKLKSLKQSTQVGDRVKTPDNSPESFTRLKGGQGHVDNKTGTVFQKSNTNRSNSPGGKFKAGTKPGTPPAPNNKVTISRGEEGGCVIKKDGC